VDPSLSAYVVLTAILVGTPGASTAVVVRNVVSGGRAAGLAAACGIAVANTTWAAAAGLGVAAILARAPVAFAAIRIGGAAYLTFLGLRALGRAAVGSGNPMTMGARGTAEPHPRAALREGIATNLLNPPIVTFYLAVVPSFMPTPSAGRFALLAAIHVGLALLCHAAWAIGFDALGPLWTRPAARRGVDAVVGVALLALAVRMLR
jgi:threonine/homoserine/homoserine lactone efflux protein